MPNYISEDDIEKQFVKKLQQDSPLWKTLNCFTAKPEDLNDHSGRTDKSEVLLLDRLHAAVEKLNPGIPDEARRRAVAQVAAPRFNQALIVANRELDGFLREGVQIEYNNVAGHKETGQVRFLDFDNPAQNDFLAVTQLWIKGDIYWRRPDVILYINGLPLVLIELKNSNVKVKSAYDDNLFNYKKELPRLFHFNAFVLLSNALETRVGSLTASWDFFFSWLRPEDEREHVDRKEIEEQGISLERAATGLCRPERLLDYIENFVMFEGGNKVVAQNHQFLGVNRALDAIEHRKEKEGKLGVFWHNQGAGKSYSMIFLVRKVNRKLTGSYTFVIITDREDLDKQIYRNFLNTGAVLEADAARPTSGQQLRDFLAQKKRLVFTLIQKFHYDKGKTYPTLSESDDVIVIVDEAHRTQYKDLAENMRAGLKNASYLAFTGTPLLGKNKTHAWFGEYISEYNFAQSIEDGATVPLFYQKRVPEVCLQNDELNEQLAEVVEDDNLSATAQKKLEQEFGSMTALIKSDDRLDKIATDIVEHFPQRGFLGKGMVVCVDKFTAVKMHDKVSALWNKKKRELQGELNREKDPLLKARLKTRLDFMTTTELGVVISEEADEEAKFQAVGLSIKPHRDRMSKIDANGKDYEDNFKDPTHPFRLVFVCAMWLTGFDVPSLSTLYLDKPMHDHTLMQAIARANRVCPTTILGVGKTNGEIIDYFNVFRDMKKALAAYGRGGDKPEDQPVQVKDNLFALLDNTLTEAITFCKEHGVNIEEISVGDHAFKKLDQFNTFANILLKNDETSKAFAIHENLISTLAEACKPEIYKQPRPLVGVFAYLRGVMDMYQKSGNEDGLESARQRFAEIMDQSISAQQVVDGKGSYKIIDQSQVWDLSKSDFDKLRAEFAQREYPALEIADLRRFLQEKLAALLIQNVTRRSFAERLQEIIDRYNAGGSATENIYSELLEFTQALKEEEERHIREGLTEAELELYDLLKKDKLNQVEEQAVKNAAQTLFKRLKEEQPKVLVPDWYRNDQSSERVKAAIRETLNKTLPESYDREIFTRTLDTAYNHLYSSATRGGFYQA